MSAAADPTQTGLCATCRHLQVIPSCRGPVYFRCQLSQTQPQYPRYPRLPVLQCKGFAPAGQGAGKRQP